MATKKRKKNNKRKAAVKLPLFVVILLIIAALVLAFLWWKGYLDIWLKPGDSAGGGTGDTPGGETIVTDDLQIHFPELGNNRSGDCTLIKVGDTEVLVDAGSQRNSAETIGNYLNKYVTDGKIEYVIATHAHDDHISAFVGTKQVKGVFDRFEFGTIIDFPKTNQKPKTDAGNDTLYKEYCDKRDALVEGGAIH